MQNLKRTTKDIEMSSNNLIQEISGQTDKLKTINNKVILMNDNYDDSDNIMNQIIKRENRNRLLTILFAFVLFIAFIIFIFLRYN